jgi:hypothetical protein
VRCGQWPAQSGAEVNGVRLWAVASDVDSIEVASMIAVAGSLAGVLVGGVGAWLLSRVTARRADRALRDEQFAALEASASQIIVAVKDKRAAEPSWIDVKAKQAAFRAETAAVHRDLYSSAFKLALHDDQALAEAARRVNRTATQLREHALDSEGYSTFAGDLDTALVRLQYARDLAATSSWRWRASRRLRREIEIRTPDWDAP